jgi:LPS export ABC transporter protein LptC
MENKKNRTSRIFSILYCLFPILLVSACSFEYEVSGEDSQRGIVLTMKDMEYVGIREGNPSMRIRAEEARRFENKHSMELDNFSFEQFTGGASPGLAGQDPAASPEREETGIGARGRAGTARIELDTRNFFMTGGVSIESISEDISIETPNVNWKDKERTLSAPGEVRILRSNGTELSGRGFSADLRRRTWEFQEAVEGSITEEN